MKRALAAAVLSAALAMATGALAEPLAYVALADAGKVAVVDVGTGNVVRTFPVAVSPHGIAVSADGRLVFVPDLSRKKWIQVLDARTGGEIRRVMVGAPAHHLALAPDGRRLYATLTSVGQLAMIELNNWRVRTVKVGGAPDYAVPASDGKRVYVSDIEGSTLAVVDPAVARIRTRIRIGGKPGHGVVTADGTRGYFTSTGTGAISVIDLEQERQIDRSRPAWRGHWLRWSSALRVEPQGRDRHRHQPGDAGPGRHHSRRRRAGARDCHSRRAADSRRNA